MDSAFKARFQELESMIKRQATTRKPTPTMGFSRQQAPPKARETVRWP